MPSNRTIFTIGHSPFLLFSSFVRSLQRNGVNCVVDIRNFDSAIIMKEYHEEELRTNLKKHGIDYLTFFDEFAKFDINLKDSSGVPIYNKVKQTDSFKKGIQRLENGMNRGYVIALLGIPIFPEDCFRFTCIAPYLEELGYEVMHIFEGGKAVSHKQIMERRTEDSSFFQIRKQHAGEIGSSGEELAADYLMQNGYTILDRNWNLHKGCELDIVAFKDNVIHAIEVKTRRNDKFVSPEQAINKDKLNNINKALMQYRKQKHLLNLPVQIDSIAIVLKSETDYTINMYENLVLKYSWRY